MTTIAWDGKTLAADTLVTQRDRRCGRVEKIEGFRGVLWGVSGCLIHMDEFRSWMRSGMTGDAPTMKTREGATSEAIVIAGGWLLSFDEHGVDRMVCPERYALGTGAPLALGAMAHGASAEQAVRLACEIDIYSGGAVTVIQAPPYETLPHFQALRSCACARSHPLTD